MKRYASKEKKPRPDRRSARGRADLVSWLAAACAFALAAGFGVYELRGKLFTNELIARIEGERTLNLLMSVARSARDPQEGRIDFRMPVAPFDASMEARELAQAIQSHSALGERVLGLAAYDREGRALFRVGTAPALNAERVGGMETQSGNPPRWYRFDASTRTMRIMHPFPVLRPRSSEPQSANGAALFYELKEEALFRNNAIASAVFAAWLVAAFAAVILVRGVTRRNAVYREALRDQRELVALGSAARTLAHEIKNPLGAIRLQADLIARLCPGAADRELRGIGEEVGRIRLLVDRIGDFLREPAGSPERFGLGAFAAEVLVRSSPDGGAVPVAIEGADPEVVADRERLRSVAENLARNAYESGGPPESVSVRVREEGGRAVLEILDRGKGFSAEAEAERAFDPFFTTKTQGFGLGLALSRRFVEAAGGSLSLSSRPDGGAIARVSLPRSYS